MHALKRFSAILALGLAMLFFRIGPAGAAAFEVVIDTSGLSGDAVMAFDFGNSDPGSEHQLVISDFASDGSIYMSATANPGDCPSPVFPFSGDACKDPAGSSVTGTLGLNPPITISDAGSSDPTISYYQRIDLSGATYLSFRFEMSGDPTTEGASPDGFAFWLLNPGDVQSLVGSTGGDLLLPGPLILYTFAGACDTEFSEGAASCTEVRVPSVPEPAPMALIVAALLAWICARRPVSALHRRRAVRA